MHFIINTLFNAELNGTRHFLASSKLAQLVVQPVRGYLHRYPLASAWATLLVMVEQQEQGWWRVQEQARQYRMLGEGLWKPVHSEGMVEHEHDSGDQRSNMQKNVKGGQPEARL